MYGEIYITDNGSNSRYVEPLNYDAISIKTSKVTESGAWAFQTEMNDVQISGVDYTWLYDLMLLDKCKVWNIQFIKDGSIKYNGEFNYYMCRVDFDKCIISIDSNKSSKLQRLLSILSANYNLDEIVSSRQILNYRNGKYYTGYNINNIINTIIGVNHGATGLVLQSEFLTAIYTPVPSNPVINSMSLPLLIGFDTINVNVNLYNKLYLANTPSGNNSKINISLSDILTQLCTILKLYWYVDEINNKLVIEHIKFFENGLSYTLNMPIGVDLTTLNDGNNLIETNNYRFGIKNVPTVYRLKYEIGYEEEIPYTGQWGGRDFDLYNFSIGTVGQCTLTRGQELHNSDWNTSIVKAEIDGKETITILACEDVYSINNVPITSIRDLAVSYQDQSIYSGYLVNHPFESTLVFQLHLYDQYFPILNRDANFSGYEALSRKKIVMQDALRFNYCENIDPYKLVKTTLLDGNGYIDSFDVDLYGTVQMELRYEDN